VVNSTLQPSLGLRWLLVWEERQAERVHLQKAAPKHWFEAGKHMGVRRCPTRFGKIEWRTEAETSTRWRVTITADAGWAAEVVLHVHPPGGARLRRSSAGTVADSWVVIPAGALGSGKPLSFTVEA
jgi:hypothetical protein